MVARTKSRLFDEVPKLPGSRVVEGRISVEPIGIGVPKGRNGAGARFVEQFVADAKASGQVRRAIESAGLRGVTVAAAR